MLQPIKRSLYTILLFAGRVLFGNKQSKIIYYHDLHGSEEAKCSDMSTPIALFRQHLGLLKANGYEIVKVITKPRMQIQITFDDGFKGIYLNREYLISEQVFPTIFVITSSVGNPDYLTWQELKELRDLGFRIQSHTHYHQELNNISDENLFEELNISKQILEENLNIVADEVCFPKGLFNEKVLDCCHLIGYKKWYCSIPGTYEQQSNYKELKFRNLVQFSSARDFKNIIEGGMRILRRRYSKQHYGKDIFFQ